MLKYIFHRIVPTTRSKGILLSFVFLLFFSCFLTSTIAQVTIKEKIELNGLPENKINKGPSIIYTDTVVSGFIMPNSGTLECYYAYLTHFYSSMPDYSSLNSYFFKGDSLKNDSLMSRFYLNNSWQRNYQSCYPPTRYEWDYFPSNQPDEYLWDVDKVTEGDSIKVTYFSDWIASQDTFTYPVYSATEIWVDSALVGWDVILGNYDWCMEEFDNALFISIGVRDLFNVSLEPKEIFPGDTADIIIKKVLKDGTLADFDTSQTFELGKLEGCEAGYLLAEGDTSAHFYNVHQPFKFIAADSIDGDSATVKIRVGLIDSPGNDSPLLSEKSIVNGKKSSKIKYNELITGNVNKKMSVEIPRKGLEHFQLKRTPRDSLEIGTRLLSHWKKPKARGKDDISFSCFPENWWIEKLNQDANETVKNNEQKILLGQTKYYQARYKTAGKLIIEEVPADENGVPHLLNGGLAENVWVDPVTVIDNLSNSGKKIGVYWEKKYPQYGEKTYENGYYAGRKFNGMEQLETGLIRIIGRYWSPDSIYKVKLKAKYQSDSTYIKIVIVNPDSLKDPEQTAPLRYYIDVNDNIFNIDSLCILFGGSLGIPPHFIKGHIFREAAHIDFGEPNGEMFTPSFRYEPYTVQYWPNLKQAVGRFFFDDTASVNYSDVPQHANVHYMDYIRNVKTVWNMIDEYSQLENPNNPTHYGKQNADHTMNFYPNLFKAIQDQYNKFLFYYENQKKLTRPTSADSANAAMIKWFKEDWIKNKTKANPEQKIAHTRGASSYGLLQMLYTTALWKLKTFIQNKVPEEMNENLFFYQSLIHQKNKLIEYLGSNNESGNDWNDGFEMSFVNSIYSTWNESEGYAEDIVKKSTKFLPK